MESIDTQTRAVARSRRYSGEKKKHAVRMVFAQTRIASAGSVGLVLARMAVCSVRAVRSGQGALRVSTAGSISCWVTTRR